MPLKAKIRKEKEKAFKDLKNEKWASDFELEVTNTGDKPIYEFYLLLITDVKADIGYRIIFPVYYGRTELGDIRTKAMPEDIPIKPGESCILKIHPGQIAAWELGQRKENRPQPKRIKIVFQGLSFGDGTGFAGSDGTALPRKIAEQSSVGGYIKPTALEIASKQNKFQEGVASSPKEERELEDKIPRHVPIRIKIPEEKEKAFKDLTNKHWARDFELEVKNTGTKPIYYLVLLLDLPEVRVGNGNIIFDLRYGREALNAFEERLELAKAEDVPINPGEIYTFKLPKSRVDAWENFVLKEKRLQPRKLRVEFEGLNFGDGTGYRNLEGIPLPRPDKKQSSRACLQNNKSAVQANHARSPTRRRDTDTEKFPLGGELTSYLPARFLLAGPGFAPSSSIESNLEPGCGCNGSGCSYVREYNSTTTCAGNNCEIIHMADGVDCLDSRGNCRVVDIRFRLCEVREDGYNYDHLCPYSVTSFLLIRTNANTNTNTNTNANADSQSYSLPAIELY